MDPVSLEELHNITHQASLGLLHQVSWALGNESADLHSNSVATLNVQCLNELIITKMLVIEHDQNYTSIVVSVLS